MHAGSCVYRSNTVIIMVVDSWLSRAAVAMETGMELYQTVIPPLVSLVGRLTGITIRVCVTNVGHSRLCANR